MAKKTNAPKVIVPVGYGDLISDISVLLDQARRTTVRTVNSILTATYWEVGRRIVEFEQGGKERAEYGESLLKRLGADLTTKFGRGFGAVNLSQMKKFYLLWPTEQIFQTVSEKSDEPVKGKLGDEKLQMTSAKSLTRAPANSPIFQTASEESTLTKIAPRFPLPWSAYVRLMSVKNDEARKFYESESVRGGWSIRQLDRQISTQFYERTLHSKRPKALLTSNQKSLPEDSMPLEAEIRDPYLLEFLDLKDEYSESDLEDALIRHLEWFLLELGAGFTFVARQKRIRIGDSWYRIDLLLYHRGLRCLVIIDLKRGKFTHADAGQMNLYLNYVKENMMLTDEADPVGIILCSDKDDAVVKYATGGIRTRVFASKYLTDLPDEETLRQEILNAQRAIRARLKEGTADE